MNNDQIKGIVGSPGSSIQPIRQEQHERQRWDELRETAREISEELPNLSPTGQLALTLSTFYNWLKRYANILPSGNRLPAEFHDDVVDAFASAVAEDRIGVVTIPGREHKISWQSAVRRAPKDAIIEPDLTFPLRGILLETARHNASESIQAVVFFALVASIGVDPGEIATSGGADLYAQIRNAVYGKLSHLPRFILVEGKQPNVRITIKSPASGLSITFPYPPLFPQITLSPDFVEKILSELNEGIAADNPQATSRERKQIVLNRLTKVTKNVG